jgi:hypothetical protein
MTERKSREISRKTVENHGENPTENSRKWFRPRWFGWGLTPTTWQGWIAILAWIVVAAAPVIIFAKKSNAPRIHDFAKIPLDEKLAFAWLFANVIALVIFAIYYLRKNYPDRMGWQPDHKTREDLGKILAKKGGKK